ncbi:hypothetical protein [Haladaptatus sp. NG-SE-30]
MRLGGAWLAVGSFLLVVGIVLHPPPSPDQGEFIATIAEEPTRWMAAHWATAIGLAVFTIAGLIMLTTESRLTQNWWLLSAWAVLVVGALWVTTAAVAEATVITTAAVAGDTATFEMWEPFADAHGAAFVFLALAIAIIAGNEARSASEAMPTWASWVGAGAGIVAIAGFVLGLGLGFALAGIVWVVSTIVMGLWTLWFGVALMRFKPTAQTPSEGAPV